MPGRQNVCGTTTSRSSAARYATASSSAVEGGGDRAGADVGREALPLAVVPRRPAGLAIAGIALVDVPDLLQVDAGAGAAANATVRTAFDLLVQERFIPVFEVLFGVGRSLTVEVGGVPARRAHPAPVDQHQVLPVGVEPGVHCVVGLDGRAPVRAQPDVLQDAGDLVVAVHRTGHRVGGRPPLDHRDAVPGPYSLTITSTCCSSWWKVSSMADPYSAPWTPAIRPARSSGARNEGGGGGPHL